MFAVHEKAKVNQPGRGSAFAKLAAETTRRSTNQTTGETAKCAESNPEEGVKKKKKRRRNGMKSRKLEAPRVLGEREQPPGCSRD